MCLHVVPDQPRRSLADESNKRLECGFHMPVGVNRFANIMQQCCPKEFFVTGHWLEDRLASTNHWKSVWRHDAWQCNIRQLRAVTSNVTPPRRSGGAASTMTCLGFAVANPTYEAKKINRPIPNEGYRPGYVLLRSVGGKNGAAGRNAKVSACYCTSFLMTLANPKNDPSAEIGRPKRYGSLFNCRTMILDALRRSASCIGIIMPPS